MLSDATRQQLDDMITRGRSNQDETFQLWLDSNYVLTDNFNAMINVMFGANL